MTNRQFAKCDTCNEKPATIRRWATQNDCTRLCYNCDIKVLESSGPQRKEIIPYEEMITLGNVRSLMRISSGPLKENENYLHPNHSTTDRQASSIIRSPIKQTFSPSIQSEPVIDPKLVTQSQAQLYQRNHQIKPYHDESFSSKKHVEIQGANNLPESIELRYKIRLQEQDNTIHLLKSHIESIEISHQENLSKVRNENKLYDEAKHSQIEKQSIEIQRINSDCDNRINQYILQLEQERQRRDCLEQKLDSLRQSKFDSFNRKNHDNKTQDLQQQVTQLRAEIERQKMEKEKIIFDCDRDLSKQRQISDEETERIITQVKQEFSHKINDLISRLSYQQDLNQELEYKVQQLQVSLQEVNIVWQQRDMQQQQEVRESRTQLRAELNSKVAMKADNINLRDELLIVQKEQELFHKEKLQVDRKISLMSEKAEKLERFIYGGKRNNNNNKKK